LTFEDLIVQYAPTSPVNPEQSFVAWNAFVTRGAWLWEDAAVTENPSAASNATAVASPRTLFGNPLRPVIERSGLNIFLTSF
jgi:hypothetical protein